MSVKKLSIKKFVTGKIIRHFLSTNFLIGYLKTLIELKKPSLTLITHYFVCVVFVLFVLIWKQYPENFAFLIQRMPRKFANLLKSRPICKQTFLISHQRISQKVKGALMWNLQHMAFIWRRSIGWFSNLH